MTDSTQSNNETIDPKKQDHSTEEQGLPFVAPCKELDMGAPLRWIKLGYSDLVHAPKPSLTYGMAMVAIVYGIGAVALAFGNFISIISLITGFIFLGPILALGLYSISCQRQMGQTPVLGYCIREGKRHLSNEAIYGFVLLVVFLIWARATSVVHIFFPSHTEPDWDELMLFLSILIVVGTIFATIIFSASAFSLPMIMDRKADMITAIITSVNAVLKNKMVMALWAMIIVSFMAISVLTAFFGLAVLLPIIGHATWHAYQETIDSSQWPKHD